jgi:hypothetical protein
VANLGGSFLATRGAKRAVLSGFRTIMDITTFIVSVAVPVGTVLLALIIQARLSALIWRGFLKLSSPASRP